jgi:hypothetical protein
MTVTLTPLEERNQARFSSCANWCGLASKAVTLVS